MADELVPIAEESIPVAKASSPMAFAPSAPAVALPKAEEDSPVAPDSVYSSDSDRSSWPLRTDNDLAEAEGSEREMTAPQMSAVEPATPPVPAESPSEQDELDVAQSEPPDDQTAAGNDFRHQRQHFRPEQTQAQQTASSRFGADDDPFAEGNDTRQTNPQDQTAATEQSAARGSTACTPTRRG